MDAIMLSIRPKFCNLIVSGKKSIDVRKTCPKLETPFKCYIYCTKAKNKNEDLWSDARIEPIIQDGEERWQYVAGSMHYMNGTVIGEFVCERIKTINEYTVTIANEEHYLFCGGTLDGTGLTGEEMYNYGKGETLYGLHISDLKIYDKPKELDDFFHPECTDDSHCDTCPSSVSLGYPYGDECNTDGYRRVIRPPQSWCYVEPLLNREVRNETQGL